MKKIVCLIRPNPPLVYFANAIHAAHSVSLVVVETKMRRGPARWWPAVRARWARGNDATREQRFDLNLRSRQQAAVLEQTFGATWRRLPPEVPVLTVPSVNDPGVLEHLRRIGPDVLLDHGTSIVGDPVLRTAPLALNLHWGLSPYYRGTHCTEWALLNWDPYNIGVTIHRLTRQIDGGDIVAQARAAITAAESVESINLQLTKLGTRLVIETLNAIDRGESLRFHRQDFSHGLLTLNRQWSRRLRSHLRRLLRQGGLQSMLRRPARKQRLPLMALETHDAPLIEQPSVAELVGVRAI